MSAQSEKVEKPVQPVPEIPAAAITAPKMRISALGGTFGSLKKKDTVQVSAAEEELVSNGAVKAFDNEQLGFQWMAMCNRMAQNRKLIGLATSMRNLEPRITDYPNVEIVVTNSILLDQLKEINSRIRATLAKELSNSEIQVSYRLAENTEIKRVLTPPELFDKLKNQYSVFNHLVKELELELM